MKKVEQFETTKSHSKFIGIIHGYKDWPELISEDFDTIEEVENWAKYWQPKGRLRIVVPYTE